MSANRISHLFQQSSGRKEAQQPKPEKGFAAVPLQPLEDVTDRWSDLKILYEMAYLMARTGYVVGE